MMKYNTEYNHFLRTFTDKQSIHPTAHSLNGRRAWKPILKEKERESCIRRRRNLKQQRLNRYDQPQMNLFGTASTFGGADVTNAINNFADIDVDALNGLFKNFGSEEALGAFAAFSTIADTIKMNGGATPTAENSTVLGEKLDSLLGRASAMVDVFGTFFKSLKDLKSALAIVIPAMALWTIIQEKDSELCRDTVFFLCAIYCCLFGTEIVAYISDLFTTPQSFFDQNGLFSLVGAMICFSFPEKTRKDVTSFFRTFNEWGKAQGGIRDIITFIFDLLNRLMNFLINKITGRDAYVKYFGSCDNPLLTSIEEAAVVIENKISTESFPPNQENYLLLHSIVEDITKFLRVLPRNSDTSNLIQYLFRMQSRYQKMLDTFAGTGYINGSIRQEPGCIFFRGPAGTGKSILMSLLATVCVLALTPPELHEKVRENPHNYSFYKRSGLKHWDTYTTNHIVTILDDFGQSADVAGGEESDFMSLINMVNTIPYPLPMAELERKGRSFFNSKLIFATTNLRDVRPTSIISPEAFKRRVHKLVRIIPKPEFCTDGNLDTAKFPLVDGKTQLHPNMCWYQLETWERDPLSEPMEFETLVEIILELERQKAENFASLRDVTQEAFNRAQPVVDEPQVNWSEVLGEDVNFGPAMEPIDEGITFESERSQLIYAHLIQNVDQRSWERLATEIGLPHAPAVQTLTALVQLYPDAMMYVYKDWEPHGEHVHWQRFKDAVNWYEGPSLRAIPLDLNGFKECVSMLRSKARLVIGYLFGEFLIPFWELQWRLVDVLGIHTMAFIYGFLFQIAIFGVGFLITKAGKLVRSIILMFFSKIYPQSVTKEENNVKIQRNAQKIKMRSDVEKQVGGDPNGCDIMTSVLKTNTYEMQINGSTIGFATCIKERIFIMPWHFITHLFARVSNGSYSPSKVARFVKTNNRNIGFEVTLSDLFEYFEETELQFNDLVLVQLPRHVPLHRDIVDYFVDDGIMRKMLSNCEALISFPFVDGVIHHNTTADFAQNRRINDIDGTWYELREYFMYRGVDTMKGHCGGLVSYLNPRIQKKKIFGIHVAGNTTNRSGFCAVVTSDSLRKALKAFKVIETIVPEGIDQDIPQGLFTDLFFGTGTANKTPRVPCKTSFTKTLMHDDIPDAQQLKPPRLEEFLHNGNYSRMYDGFNKFFLRAVDFSREVQEEYHYIMQNGRGVVERRIFSFEEACEGIDEHFKNIDRGTSTGWPYNTSRSSSKKAYFFGRGEKFDYTRSSAIEMRKECDTIISLAVQGVRLPQIYSDFPKDELYPVHKADTKYRPISGATCAYTIVVKRYFGAFMKQLNMDSFLIGYATSVDPVRDWDSIARLLLSKGTTVGAGDYDKYDKNQQPSVMWAVLDMINLWYGDSDENQRIREILWLEIVNSWHIFKNTVFFMCSGMPSGNPLTFIVNSVANRLLFRKVWNLIMATLQFDEHVYLIVGGDDNLFSVTDEAKSRFNEHTIGEHLLSLGYVYTSEMKVERDGTRLRNITECEFLKRGFRFEKELGKWMGPLRLERALSLPCWNRDEDLLVLKDRVYVMMRELALHGKEVYEKYVPGILDLYAKHYKRRQGWFCVTSYYAVLREVTGYEWLDDEKPLIVKESLRNSILRQGGPDPIALEEWNQPELSTVQEYTLKQGGTEFARCSPADIEAAYPQSGFENNSSPNPVKRIPETEIKEEDGVLPYKQEQCGPSAQTDGTTQMIEDDSCHRVEVAMIPKVPSGLGFQANYATEFIQKFLARPYLVQSGVFAATDTAATFTQISYPSTLMNYTIYLEKLRGFELFKGTGVFTLRVNASRFHCGLYKLAYLESGGANVNTTWINSHYYSQQQRSQLPGVMIDIATETAVQMKIPYRNAFRGNTIKNTAPNFYETGTVALFPLSPLNVGVGQDSTVGYNIWFRWEDVELDFPAYPQMALPSEEESEKLSAGPMGSVEVGVRKGAAIVRKVGRKFPLIASVTETASWAMDILGDTFNIFGWSKPLSQIKNEQMVMDAMYNAHHVDGLDNSRSLALFRSNIVDPMQSLISNADELSLDSFLMRPTVLTKFTWASTDAVTTLIYSLDVSPKVSISRTSDGLNVTCHTPMSLMSTMFNAYRGDIMMRFHIVKTEMHSGRLAFYYQPIPNGTSIANVSLTNSVYTLRKIVDLRYESVVEFRLPYYYNRAYRTMDSEFNMGKLHVVVVSELVAPTTAAQTIEILPWIYAAPGFEFAIPIGCNQTPVSGLSIDPVPQACIGDYPETPNTLDPSLACVGERLLSLRQFLRSIREVKLNSTFFASSYCEHYPFFNEWVNRSGGISTFPPAYGGHKHIFESIYAISRGGLRVKYIGDTSTNVYRMYWRTPTVMTAPLSFGNPAPPGGTAAVTTSRNYVYSDRATRGGVELQIPSYGTTPFRSNATATSPANAGIIGNASVPPLAISFQATGAPNFLLMLGGADDYDLAGFVSIPPMYTFTGP